MCRRLREWSNRDGFELGLVLAWPAIALALAIAFLSSCAHVPLEALDGQVRAARATREALEGARDAIQTARHSEQMRAVEAAPDRESAAESASAIRARWEPAVAAFDAVADAHAVWVQALLGVALSESKGDLIQAIPAGLAMFDLYQSLVRAAHDAGLELPPIPDAAARLIAAGRGLL